MSSKYLALDAAEVARQVERLFTEYHDEVEGDEALRADLLLGETNFYELVDKALDHRQEALGMAAMTKERASGMKERQTRYENRAEALSSLILNLMDVAGIDRVELPVATISRTKGRESVEITNVDELPQGTFTTERKPDKKAIGDQLKAGADVPGARLVTGEDGLRVNTK